MSSDRGALQKKKKSVSVYMTHSSNTQPIIFEDRNNLLSHRTTRPEVGLTVSGAQFPQTLLLSLPLSPASAVWAPWKQTASCGSRISVGVLASLSPQSRPLAKLSLFCFPLCAMQLFQVLAVHSCRLSIYGCSLSALYLYYFRQHGARVHAFNPLPMLLL